MERGRISEDMTQENMLSKAEKVIRKQRIIHAALVVLLLALSATLKVVFILYFQGKNDQIWKGKVSNETLKQQDQILCHDNHKHCFFHGGHLYYFSCVSMSWNDAEQHCVLKGSHLTSVTSVAEQEFIYEKGPNSTFWIGLTNQKSSNWIWTDGTPFNETQSKMFWAPGQPTNREHNEHCAVSWTVNHKLWYNKDCKTHFKFICKRKQHQPRLHSQPMNSSDPHALNKVERPVNKSTRSY